MFSNKGSETQTGSNSQKPFSPSVFILRSPLLDSSYLSSSLLLLDFLSPTPLQFRQTFENATRDTLQLQNVNMPPYAITPFKDLCLTLQPLNPHLRPMPAVCITALPLEDKRDPIWADPCCLQCAKLVGSVDLFCVPHPNKNEHKCIRCFNLNITCVPIPEEHIEKFRSIQVFFKKRDLKYAFLFRRAWIMGMNNEPSARIGRQFFLLNRNIERLINTQLAIVRFCRFD